MNKDSAIICFYNAHPRYHIRDTGRQKPLALQYEMTCLLHLNINTKVSCHDIFLSSDYIWLKFQCYVIRIILRSIGKVEEKKSCQILHTIKHLRCPPSWKSQIRVGLRRKACQWCSLLRGKASVVEILSWSRTKKKSNNVSSSMNRSNNTSAAAAAWA